MKHRSYSFQTNWNIDAPTEKVWQTLTATPFSWDAWWPELNDLSVQTKTTKLVGTAFSCTWKAPIGYKLRTDVRITEAEDREFVTLETDGDLDGTVSCYIKDISGTTHVDIDWQVETTRDWMNALHPLLKPFFIWSHHAVMRSGERGLQKHIANK